MGGVLGSGRDRIEGSRTWAARYCAPVPAQTVSLLISLLALAVAAYGIFERKAAATRAERIRLSVITDDLQKIKLELLTAGAFGGNVEALHTRTELLAQQALSLIREHAIPATSAECRAVAFGLGRVHCTEDAEEVWRLAINKGQSEGDAQGLFAVRGYGYYLFEQGQLDKARQKLNLVVSQISPTDDQERLLLAETLHSWAFWEANMSSSGSNTVNSMLERIRALSVECQAPAVKATIEMLCVSAPFSVDG
jgi:hypothetical protein